MSTDKKYYVDLFDLNIDNDEILTSLKKSTTTKAKLTNNHFNLKNGFMQIGLDQQTTANCKSKLWLGPDNNFQL